MLDGKDYEIKLINNTKFNYIIDPYSFREDNAIVDSSSNLLFPINHFIQGYYKRFNEEQCAEDYIILKPKEEKFVSLSIFSLKGNYDLKINEKYYLKLKSFQNRNTVIQYGCEEFIDNFEKQGYKIFEDNIEAKIPLIP